MNENAEKKISFTVEGKTFDSAEEQLTARDIIERARETGIEAAQEGAEKLTLECGQSVYRQDDLVDLSQHNEFSIREAVYKFTVNGQQLETDFEKLVSLDIIVMAKKEGAIKGKPEELLLETIEVEGKKECFRHDDWVELWVHKEFLVIDNNSTPVA